MKRTFGEQPTQAPKGNFRPIEFPQLARLGEGTKEGMISRVLTPDGGTVADLPRTIYFQDTQDMGHLGSVAAGSLHEVTFDTATGIMSGKGWIADDEAGHAMEAAVVSRKLFHNSVDLGDIPHDGIRFVEHGDFWDDDFWVEVIFEQYAVRATTLVGKPAFTNAQAEISEEIMASLCGLDTPLVVECESYGFDGHTPVEIMASAAGGLPKWEYFHRPESDIPHKIVLGERDENGWIPVYGHLAKWGERHIGYDGTPVYVPRPTNGYAEWNQPTFFSDGGRVATGPIVLYGGHISLKEACDDPKNAWADVTMHVGKHGPWMSGVVRPHIAEDAAQQHVASASRTSGHWKDGKLRMIISCSVPGFNIDGATEPGELVASFDPTPQQRQPIPVELFTFSELSQDAQDRVLAWVQSGRTLVDVDTTAAVEAINASAEASEQFDIEVERARRERELALQLEDA